MFRIFLMAVSGSSFKTTKSAHLPFSRGPTSSRPRQRAASTVAERRICSGVIPASAIIESSMCSKYPWNRAAGPVSVPKAMMTPESAAFFRFTFACSRAFLYAIVEGKNPEEDFRPGFRLQEPLALLPRLPQSSRPKGATRPSTARATRESSISPGRGSLRGAQSGVGGPLREKPRFLARLHRYGGHFSHPRERRRETPELRPTASSSSEMARLDSSGLFGEYPLLCPC